MGTWGAGVFENDDALDFVADQMDEYFKTIEIFFATEDPDFLEEGEGEIIPRIKLMTMFARLGREAGDPIIRCAPPEQATIEQWKAAYLAGFDEQIEDYEPDEEYLDARRAELEQVFDELIQEADLLDELLEEAQKLQEAQEDEFLEMAKEVEGDAEVTLRCAEIYLGRQKWKDAAEKYKEAIELGVDESDEAFAFNNLAWCLAQEKEFEEATQWVEKALNSDSPFPYFYGTLGYIHYATGQLKLALEQYDKALEAHDNTDAEEGMFDPSLAETHYWRSKVHEELGNEEACEKDLMMIKLLGARPPEDD